MDVADVAKTLSKTGSVKDRNRVDAPVFGDVPYSGTTTKRNPAMVGGGVLFAVLAAFVGALLVNARGTRQGVVVTATEISAGTRITREMLRIEHIEGDSTLRVTKSQAASSLVGQVARERIAAGVLILPEQVGSALQPPAGFVLVAMVLEPGELPVSSLVYGDRVEVVRTPTQSTVDDPGGVITVASVWSMWGGSSAQTVTASSTKRTLTLAVPEADGVKVTQAAARREIRLIGRGGGPVWTVESVEEDFAVVPAEETSESTPVDSSEAG
jgi:Flp pilus assembly protein CpaB